MYRVKKKDGSFTKDYHEILNLQYEFYQDLYSEDKSVNFTIRNDSGVMLSEILREEMDQSMSVNELYDGLMTLKPRKTPDCDGLGLAFYKVFWSEISDLLLEVYNQAILEGKLNPSGRRGIINLIPKKNREDYHIKNWRPITLLNYEYKIFAKAISN